MGKPNQPRENHRAIGRREFLSGTAMAAAASFVMVKPERVRGTQANSRIKLGLVGCGGRGTWIAGLFIRHGGYEMAAVSDYFKDRVDAFGTQFNIPAGRRFDGLYGYKRLIDSGVDAIAIESPPYFHPEQAAAGVEAGKHVYLAKPVAVDVPGCRSVSESGEKASSKKLCFLVDFQTRANTLFIEAVRRVHGGAIGNLSFGEATYHAGIPWTKQYPFLETKPVTAESRLRAWGLSRTLSGDIITEQNIHTIDVMSWIMDRPPLQAFGTGSRKVRPIGECWDHFSIIFQYPENVDIAFTSQGVHSAPSHPHIAEEELYDGKGPDILHPYRVLRPTHRVTGRGCPVRLTRGADGLVDLFDLVLWGAGDLRDLVDRVTGIVLLQ